MKKFHLFGMVSMMVLLSAACATRGPIVPHEPTVRVAQFDTAIFTPDHIEFQAKILIQNQMSVGLNVRKIEYGADVNDKLLSAQTATDLKPVKAEGERVVDLPFQLSMKDLAQQGVNVRRDESITVIFKGQVYTDGSFGIGPAPFAMTKTVFLPKAPSFSLEGTEGSLLKVFTVYLNAKNNNPFPLKILSMISYLEINGTKYDLLRTQGDLEIKAGEAETITLTMEPTIGTKMSLAMKLARASSLKFSIGGGLRCQTPYGLLVIPFALASDKK